MYTVLTKSNGVVSILSSESLANHNTITKELHRSHTQFTKAIQVQTPYSNNRNEDYLHKLALKHTRKHTRKHTPPNQNSTTSTRV